MGEISFVVRPIPESGESLTSYFQRVAKANYLSPHELWRSFTDKNLRYPQSTSADLIDYVPSSVLDLGKFAAQLKADVGAIDKLTFKVVLEKLLPLGFSDEDMLSKRILSSLIYKHRKFCPECVKENSYYKLIWQIEEVKYCYEHEVELLNSCPKCFTHIPLLGVNSIIGICEKCGFNLTYSETKKVVLNNNENRIMDDWMFLLSLDVAKSTDVVNTRTIAIRLLYILNGLQPKLSKEIIDSTSIDLTTVRGLLQSARGSRSMQSFTHLKILLEILRKLQVPLHRFFQIKAPEVFTESVMETKKTIKNCYSCLAPWCSSYVTPGSLKKTGTSKKELEGSQVFHYYMYCEKCGIEYAIDKKAGKLVERGYFINIAWNLVRPRLMSGKNRSEIALELGISQHKVLRSTVFLYANALIDKSLLNLDLPDCPNYKEKNQLIQLVLKGGKAKELPEKFGWSNAEFLYYWFQLDVIIARIKKFVPQQNKRANKDQKVALVKKALEYFIEINKNITIKSICDYLGYSQETLRLWDTLPLIKEAKIKQNQMRSQLFNKTLIDKAEHVIKSYSSNGFKLLSGELYKIISINRRVLVRKHPEVTKKITDLLKSSSNQ